MAERPVSYREALFAVYSPSEYLDEREELGAQLDKVPNFDLLSPEKQVNAIAAIGASSTSQAFQDFCRGAIINLFSERLWEGNWGLALLFAIAYVVVTLMVKMGSGSSSQNQLSHSLYKPKGLRSTVGFVPVYNTGKRNRRQVATLEPNTPVMEIEKRSGWIKICLAGKVEAIGWAQSKYLARL